MGACVSSPAEGAPRPAAHGSPGTPQAAERGLRSASNTFSPIRDTFETLPEVQAALRRRGLHACSLIVAVDFTKRRVAWEPGLGEP